MPSTPEAAAPDEVGILSALTRDELAARWAETLRAAYDRVGTTGRGRGGRWAATARDPFLRAVEREFLRRLVEDAEMLEEWDRHVSLFGWPMQ